MPSRKMMVKATRTPNQAIGSSSSPSFTRLRRSRTSCRTSADGRRHAQDDGKWFDEGGAAAKVGQEAGGDGGVLRPGTA